MEVKHAIAMRYRFDLNIAEEHPIFALVQN